MDADDEDIAQELEDEVTSVQGRAPEVPIALPPGKPNTARSLLASAAAARSAADGGRAFRREVYRAYWRDARDISDPAVLGTLPGGDVASTAEDERTVAAWRLEWERLPLRGVPLLVRGDGESLYGLKGIEELEAFLRAA
jgi:predicted DsbA family dithiol-disulfide isomerase